MNTHYHKNDIRTVDISHTNIETISPINSASTLRFNNTPISEFLDISNLKELHLLDIRNTNIKFLPKYVKNIPIRDLFTDVR